MKKLALTVFTLFSINYVFSQIVRGKVTTLLESETQPLIGVNVYWMGTTAGGTTDKNGKFQIQPAKAYPAKLIASFIGFKSDTIAFEKHPKTPINFNLNSSVNLNEVQIVARDKGTNISLIEPLLVEKISQQELRKAACCNLSESFETNASVDVNFTDAITGTKKIQMLGLDGVYSQIMIENLPFVRGLSSVYGLSFIPGTWLESISISKGSGTHLTGYESITGQINTQLIQPDSEKPLMVDVYANNRNRIESNIIYPKKINNKLSTALYVHGSTKQNKIDQNNDGFIDMPNRNTFHVMNRWKYKGDKIRFQVLGNAINQTIESGQISYINNKDLTASYGAQIDIEQYNVMLKGAYLLDNKKESSFAFMASGRIHKQKSFFGLRTYNADENYLDASLICNSLTFNRFHLLSFGGSFYVNELNQAIDLKSSNRTESIPSLLAEYTFDNDRNFSIVGGARAIAHNLYGTRVLPRLHIKYNYTVVSAIRFTVGKGFRAPYSFSDQNNLMVSNRILVNSETLKAEEAYSSGASVTHKFYIGTKEAAVNVDVFHTEYENQVVYDLENSDVVQLYNLRGRSFSTTGQIEVGIEPFERFDVKVAYKRNNSMIDYLSGFKTRPFTPLYKALVNLGYSTKWDKWSINTTAILTGAQRLPSTADNKIENRLKNQSTPFTTVNAQLTRNFKKMEFQLGAENILNYVQKGAIIAASNPFDKEFDASLIWGPLNGRIIYLLAKFKF